MHARIVRWGNSRGLRIPKALLEEAGIEEEVTIEVRDHELVVRARRAHPREGWDESYRRMAEQGDAKAVWPDDLADTFDDDVPPW